MSNGYYDGTLPDQSAGVTTQPCNSNAEYPSNANGTSTAPTATDPSIGGGSVVNDLMKVYEDMTKSSTPQVPQAAAQKYHIPPPMFSVPANGTQPLQQPNGQHRYEQSHRQAKQQDDSVPPSIPSSIQMSGSQESNTMLHNDESDDHSSSKRRRRGSHSSNSATNGKPKKKSKQDGRWSKRFTWPEDLHRDFVSAIFDVGLKQSSPSTILEQMPKHEQITTERIKSHLQKYRLHRAKSKKEFISTYEASLRKMQSQGGINGVTTTVSGGEVAAHLTYLESVDSGGKTTSSVAPTMGSAMAPGHMKGVHMSQRPAVPVLTSGHAALHPPQEESETLMLPELTELEKQSPIGSAMGYLMGLYFSLRQQLMIQRALESGQGGAAAPMQAAVGGDSHMRDMYASFAAGSMSAPAPSQAPPMATPELPSEAVPHQQAIPSMRTNIEENSIMKREMQNQMALQNKMRALKQQELAKYKNNDHGDVGNNMSTAYPYSVHEHDAYASKNNGSHMAPDQRMSHGQGAGEMGGNEVSDATTNQHRAHGLSFGNSADLWNTDVVDEQLFEFLMND